MPPRPKQFGATDPEPEEPCEHGCGNPPGTTVHRRSFGDAGRRFQTLVVVAPDAPAGARTQAWAILDNLRFDPTADRPAAGE